MRCMKLGIFIAVALCVSTSIAHADRAAPSATSIEQHRKAYELDSDPQYQKYKWN